MFTTSASAIFVNEMTVETKIERVFILRTKNDKIKK